MKKLEQQDSFEKASDLMREVNELLGSTVRKLLASDPRFADIGIVCAAVVGYECAVITLGKFNTEALIVTGEALMGLCLKQAHLAYPEETERIIEGRKKGMRGTVH